MPRTSPRSVLAVLAGVMAVCTVLIPGFTAAAAADQALENEFFGLTNASRSQNGRGALQYDPALSSIAQGWTNVMIRDDQLKHNSSLAHEVSSRVTTQWTRLGENVGVGYSAGSLQQAFMNSTGHRNNILGDYNRVGVGAARDGSGRIWVTVVFMKGPPIAATAPPASAPDGASGPAAPPPKERKAFNVTGAFVPVTGDFNGDGFGDIVWYAAGGADHVWWGSANGSFSPGSINVDGTFTPLVGDFNGDDHDDIYWFSKYGGDAIYYGTPTGWKATYPNANGNFTPLVGDFNGDDHDDIYWFSSSGGDALYSGTSTGWKATYPNATGVFDPVVGDFDGNGHDDILWQAPGPARDALWRGTTSGFAGTSVTINGTYTPIVGDFDDTPGADVLLFDETKNPDALWYR